MSSWETDDLKEKVDNLMEQTMPIYKKIHAYVRYHLAQKYPNMPTDGSIPAHLLGKPLVLFAFTFVGLTTLFSRKYVGSTVEFPTQ